MLKNFTNMTGIKHTILRPQNVYGVGQSTSNPYTGIVSIFSKQILNNVQLDVYEDGSESRDFIYVSDVVDILIQSIEKADNEIVNVGTGVKTTMIDLVNKLIDINETGGYTISKKYRVGDIRHNRADVKNMKKLYDNNELITIDEGLKLIYNWLNGE